jgi:hypothetical protein
MAPGLLVNEAAQPSSWPATALKPQNEDAPRNIFPDGIRTSGQHAPLYDVLRPYSDFPETITGPTAWNRDQFVERQDSWTRPFTDAELAELGGTADAFIASGTPLTGISKVIAMQHLIMFEPPSN